MRFPLAYLAVALMGLAACSSDDPSQPVASRPPDAQTPGGEWIHWEEQLLDDQMISGVRLRGADGFILADLNQDGRPDIVSAHEDSGHIRVAYAGENAQDWHRLSLAEGADAAGVEDVDAGDLSGDGWLDVIAACEGGRLLYLQNPAEPKPGFVWKRRVIELSLDRGSWIRASFADLDGDGRPEVVAVNKGAADGETSEEPRPISVFRVDGDPLEQESWSELKFGEYDTPINAEPYDIDGDGDLDLFAGARGERRIFWLENRSADGEIVLVERPIELSRGASSAFNVELFDFSGDGRPDALLSVGGGNLVWLEQPADPAAPWEAHLIGSFAPDSMTGFTVADIDGDSDPDVIAGSYSGGPRDQDGAEVGVDDALGRIGWFANPGDPRGEWTRHDIVRRKRGMFDAFAALDIDKDGATDFLATRGNSGLYDGVFWLRQARDTLRIERFTPGRLEDSQQMPVPAE